jgi:hypothetical protein
VRIEPEQFFAFLSAQTLAAAWEVLEWQSKRDDQLAPRPFVGRVCRKHCARMQPVMAMTSGRVQKAIVRDDNRVAVQRGRYATIHDRVALALDADDTETVAALAIYRSVDPCRERPILWVGRGFGSRRKGVS